MQDLPHAYALAAAAIKAKSPAAPALLNELAEIILDLPKPDKEGNCKVAVVGTSTFVAALELAKPALTRIARLNAKARFWAGFNV